jgi:ethanolamine ammonia-lyase small subunit
MTAKPPRRTSAPPQNARDEGLWARLRRLTAARIGLPRSGASMATAPVLDVRLAHARARDAVWEALDEGRLGADLAGLGLAVLVVDSTAADRQRFLMRPDLGRRLAPDAVGVLDQRANDFDLVFVVSGGLSARAVQRHAASVMLAVREALRKEGWRVAPVIVVRNGRVGVGDEVAAVLGATCVVVLIGERPGLTAPDSMGAYLTWEPRPETTDADRNCISNIRPGGINYAAAAAKIVDLLRAMRARRLSGVRLKDDFDSTMIEG